MSNSAKLFGRAKQCIPGGVNSPVRSFSAVGGTPLFIKRGEGAYVMDVDDNRYIDYVASWGPLIAGHAHPAVVKQVQRAVSQGLSFGAPTEIEIKLAEKICQSVPSIESIRMVNSGTEATLSAIRLARAFTRRDKIIKFIGCYHGHSDSLLAKAGSGLLTLGIPSSPGVPEDFAKHTLDASFNRLDEINQLFFRYGDDIAAVIVEPIACNMNCVPADKDFLQGLRVLCNQYRSVLIFDEVVTGFRVSLAGAQGLYDIKPDLTTLGKIIGGGMPVGAYGGAQAIMEHVAPAGPVYQAGTLSGNPVAMTAGLATLNLISKPGFYQTLQQKAERLTQGIIERARMAQIPLCINTIGSIFGLFFTKADEITQYNQVMQSDIKMFNRFFHAMLAEGVYFAPSAFESAFVSSAHKDADIDVTLNACEKVFATLK